MLEASAGTGKTFTIAALVTRFVAEGVAGLDQMLIVTFSRAATGELRERVRERLTQCRARSGRSGAARQSNDSLIALWPRPDDDEVAARRRAADPGADGLRLRDHRHHASVLRSGAGGPGVTADLAALSGGDRFVESLADLVDEVADDLYLRKFAGPQAVEGTPVIPHKEALKIAFEAVVKEPQALSGTGVGAAGFAGGHAAKVGRGRP